MSKKRNKNKRRYILATLTCIFLILIPTIYIFPVKYVVGKCMEPQIKEHTLSISNRLSYKLHDPKRGDVIAINRNGEQYLKRIIGMPGDTIEFKDGYLFIRNRLINETYISGKSYSNKTFKVPDESYFVLGDNREIANDSRHWDNAYVKKTDIIGKALINFSLDLKINQTIAGVDIKLEGETAEEKSSDQSETGTEKDTAN